MKAFDVFKVFFQRPVKFLNHRHAGNVELDPLDIAKDEIIVND